MLREQQFIALLHGQWPEFVKDEVELHAFWSAAPTCRTLLLGLVTKGSAAARLLEIRTIIDAENSDRFDGLALEDYGLQLIPPEARVEHPRHSLRPDSYLG